MDTRVALITAFLRLREERVEARAYEGALIFATARTLALTLSSPPLPGEVEALREEFLQLQKHSDGDGEFLAWERALEEVAALLGT